MSPNPTHAAVRSWRNAWDRPWATVFVDGRVADVRGAVAAGMVGVHHDDPVAAIGELAVPFGIDSPFGSGTVGPDGHRAEEGDAGT
ncbi:MAG: hypothetical protein GXY65_15525 [Rhodococcus sp.]|uniref:hypothetical protein n=1 Tax=Rhodococcus TaxID=1827 RepID=UPI001699947D|nr:hypothetical protein [Rhodococcus sp. (in: high G+C Gram-positive bacteria)]NLV80714.1 hypothetical protein [Rhodococcus sp. (in: high G+C Gram-positive bacteria)]